MQFYTKTPVSISGISFGEEPVTLSAVTPDIANAFIVKKLEILGHESLTVPERHEIAKTFVSFISTYLDKGTIAVLPAVTLDVPDEPEEPEEPHSYTGSGILTAGENNGFIGYQSELFGSITGFTTFTVYSLSTKTGETNVEIVGDFSGYSMMLTVEGSENTLEFAGYNSGANLTSFRATEEIALDDGEEYEVEITIYYLP